jgi:hypothetical protein
MSVEEWDNEYARLARAASQMRTKGFSTNQGDLRSLQQGLQRLESSIDSLPLQPAEVQRRRRLVQHLLQTADASPSTNTRMGLNLKHQDDMIDELATGVGRLKSQTILIGDEAKMHVNLLNNVDQNLDHAHAGLEEETRRASRLKEENSVWRLQLTAAGLFILMILLILLGITP